MSDSTKTFSAEQIAVAARELRDAAGAPGERFTVEQAVGMLSDEVRLLRERGFSDERVAELFSRFEIEATAEEISRFSADHGGGWGE